MIVYEYTVAVGMFAAVRGGYPGRIKAGAYIFIKKPEDKVLSIILIQAAFASVGKVQSSV